MNGWKECTDRVQDTSEGEDEWFGIGYNGSVFFLCGGGVNGDFGFT